MISELWCAKQSLIKENLSCLGVCDIDEKLYLDIFCDFIDNDNETMKKKKKTRIIFDILHILCGQFTAVTEINIFQQVLRDFDPCGHFYLYEDIFLEVCIIFCVKFLCLIHGVN